MSIHLCVSFDQHTSFENIAEKLTSSAYSHLLQYGMRSSWLELELRLWGLVREVLMKCAQELPPGSSSNQLKAWREGLVLDLTIAAFFLALDCGIKGSLREVELGLEGAFGSVINQIGQESLSLD